MCESAPVKHLALPNDSCHGMIISSSIFISIHLPQGLVQEQFLWLYSPRSFYFNGTGRIVSLFPQGLLYVHPTNTYQEFDHISEAFRITNMRGQQLIKGACIYSNTKRCSLVQGKLLQLSPCCCALQELDGKPVVGLHST